MSSPPSAKGIVNMKASGKGAQMQKFQQKRRKATFKAEEPMLKQGALMKRGHLRQNWKLRFFRLQPGKLSYFERAGDAEPIKTLPLAGCSLRAAPSAKGKTAHQFELYWDVGTKESYTFRGESAAHVQEWMTAVFDASQRPFVREAHDKPDGASPPQSPRNGDEEEDVVEGQSGMEVRKADGSWACAVCGAAYELRGEVVMHRARRHEQGNESGGGGLFRRSLSLAAGIGSGSSSGSAPTASTAAPSPATAAAPAASTGSGSGGAKSERAGLARNASNRGAHSPPLSTSPPGGESSRRSGSKRESNSARRSRQSSHARAGQVLDRTSAKVLGSSMSGSSLNASSSNMGSGSAGGATSPLNSAELPAVKTAADLARYEGEADMSAAELAALAKIKAAQVSLDEMNREFLQKRQVLLNMGFTSKLAAKALQACDGDVQSAAQWIVSQPGLLEREAAEGEDDAVDPSTFVSPPTSPRLARDSSKKNLRLKDLIRKSRKEGLGGSGSAGGGSGGSGSGGEDSAKKAEEHYRAAQRILELQEEQRHVQQLRELDKEMQNLQQGRDAEGWARLGKAMHPGSENITPDVSKAPAAAAPVSASGKTVGMSKGGQIPRESESLVAALDIESMPLPLPDLTKGEALRWTQEQLVSQQDPMNFYDISEERLGKGGFGEVYKAVHKETGVTVAIKKMKINKKNKMEYLLIETEMHAKSSQYPGVVKFHDAFCLRAEREFWLVMEYIDGGPLNSFLELDAFKEPQMAYIVREVLNALCYIHHCNRLHRDIKAQNILINSNGAVLLSDFGLSAQLSLHARHRLTILGTSDFMAPELIRADKYGVKVDIWALGMLVLEITGKGETPMHSLAPKKVLEHLEAEGPPRLTKKKASAAMKDFVAQCLQMEPDKRPTSRALTLHPWLKSSCDAADMIPLVEDVKSKGGGGCVIS